MSGTSMRLRLQLQPEVAQNHGGEVEIRALALVKLAQGMPIERTNWIILTITEQAHACPHQYVHPPNRTFGQRFPDLIGVLHRETQTVQSIRHGGLITLQHSH